MVKDIHVITKIVSVSSGGSKVWKLLFDELVQDINTCFSILWGIEGLEILSFFFGLLCYIDSFSILWGIEGLEILGSL